MCVGKIHLFLDTEILYFLIVLDGINAVQIVGEPVFHLTDSKVCLFMCLRAPILVNLIIKVEAVRDNKHDDGDNNGQAPLCDCQEHFTVQNWSTH